ncbi:hypothetical protein INT47_006287 [Mucor saturninus]|uniref:Transposase n=1 Tax=Mucor saturninus TaxID=64648 RepID=A0A8H7RK87_9FUNG|nr:hypothetical protein INT47_006287 [Mucor saturninus]
MDWEEKVDSYYLETLTRLRLYCEKQGSEQKSTDEGLDVEMEEIALKTKVKLFNAAKSGILAGGIAERTAQNKPTKLIDQQDSFEERHKIHLINLYDDNPQARVVDAVASLTEKFAGFTLKETSVRNFLKTECNLSFKKITRHPAPRNDSTKIAKRIVWVEERSKTDMDYLENCIFVDESGFDINMRPPGGWSAKGTPVIVTTPSNRAESHTILGAVSAKYVVSMELRNPQEHSFKKLKIDISNRKRKAPSKPKKPTSKGTVTGHYMKFIQKNYGRNGFHSGNERILHSNG